LIRSVYFLRVALQSITRNPILNLLAAITISLALLIMGAFLLLYVNIQNLVTTSSRGLNITVYLDDGLSAPATDRLIKNIIGLNGVASLDYVTKDQALTDLKERLGEHSGVLEGLDENPLPASFELTLKSEMNSKERLRGLTEKLKTMKGVDDVAYAWEWAEKLEVFLRFVRLAGFVVGGLLFLAIVFIIANTIKLTVLARQDELYIMRLVGATEGFIRTPFLIEGMLQGLMGGIVALFVLWIGYLLLSTHVELPLGFGMIQFTFISPVLAWMVPAAGMVLGLIGSLVSLSRSMQV
jgi:cell division transport system permease protein